MKKIIANYMYNPLTGIVKKCSIVMNDKYLIIDENEYFTKTDLWSIKVVMASDMRTTNQILLLFASVDDFAEYYLATMNEIVENENYSYKLIKEFEGE